MARPTVVVGPPLRDQYFESSGFVSDRYSGTYCTSHAMASHASVEVQLFFLKNLRGLGRIQLQKKFLF